MAVNFPVSGSFDRNDLFAATGFPWFSVNLKTLGCRSRNQGLTIRSNNFEFAHEPFAIYVEQEPHRDSVVIEILPFDWNSVSPARGRSIRYVQSDAAVVVLVLQNQAGRRRFQLLAELVPSIELMMVEERLQQSSFVVLQWSERRSLLLIHARLIVA
jgi:hypothetical protein